MLSWFHLSEHSSKIFDSGCLWELNLVLPRDIYKTLEIMSALPAAHMTVSIRCKRPVFPNLKKFSPRKKSLLDKILRGPLCNVRAYKVQAPPIGTQAGITWWPMGVLQPIHFILSAIGRQCSSVLSRFKTVQTQTLRKRKIGITLISSPQRTAVCVSKSE